MLQVCIIVCICLTHFSSPASKEILLIADRLCLYVEVVEENIYVGTSTIHSGQGRNHSINDKVHVYGGADCLCLSFCFDR